MNLVPIKSYSGKAKVRERTFDERPGELHDVDVLASTVDDDGILWYVVNAVDPVTRGTFLAYAAFIDRT